MCPSSPSSALHTAPGLGDKGLSPQLRAMPATSSFCSRNSSKTRSTSLHTRQSRGGLRRKHRARLPCRPPSPERPLSRLPRPPRSGHSLPGRGGGSGPGVTPQAEAQLGAGGVEWGCCSLWPHPAPQGRLPPLRTDGRQGLTSLQRRGSTEAGQVHKSHPGRVELSHN